MKKTILVTGGLGFIGSHTVCQLHKCNYQVIIIDDLSNSSRSNLINIESICGESIPFYEVDYSDKEVLTAIHEKFKIDAVILFSGSKYVSESMEKPLLYYKNNVGKTIELMEFLITNDINKLVFSSSAVVYGDNQNLPIRETEPMLFGSPYGNSKVMIEKIIEDASIAHPQFKSSLLRYFNPTGAHPSGCLGEDYDNKANNLVPVIMKTVVGKIDYVSVFGDSYTTKDGTGVRDYIHVMDLADGHIAALEKLFSKQAKTDTYNLGTGQGYTVLEIIESFEKSIGKKIPHKILPKRAGDIAVSYADITKAKKELNWQAKKNLQDMTDDVWYYLNQSSQL